MRATPGECVCPPEVPVAPDVAIDDEKRFVAEKRERPGDTAGRFQRTGWVRRVADVQAEALAVTERGLDLRTEMGMVDYNIMEAAGRQTFKMPND